MHSQYVYRLILATRPSTLPLGAGQPGHLAADALGDAMRTPWNGVAVVYNPPPATATRYDGGDDDDRAGDNDDSSGDDGGVHSSPMPTWTAMARAIPCDTDTAAVPFSLGR